MNPRAFISLAVVIVLALSVGYASNRHRVPGYTAALDTVTSFTQTVNDRQGVNLGHKVRVADLVNTADAHAVLALADQIRTAQRDGTVADFAFTKARELYWSSQR